MNRNTKIIKLKLDIIFKRIFGDVKNADIIRAFIEDLLEMKRGTIQEIFIDNVELPPNELDKKFSRLDLKMKVDNQIVNIEMQVNYEADFKDRTLFYWSKLYSEELGSGEEYGQLKKTICINIINFIALDNADYHSQFKVLEKNTGELLSDKFDIHFFELKKIRSAAKKRPMEDWLNLINAETEGELMDVEANTDIQEVKKAIVALRELNADEKVKQEAYYREKRLHDEASALGSARREGIAIGKAEGITIGKAEGITIGKAEGIVIGKSEGRDEMLNELIAKMKNQGYTDEQISKLLN